MFPVVSNPALLLTTFGNVEVNLIVAHKNTHKDSRDVSCCWLSSVSWLLTTFKHQHPSIPMLSCYDISTTFSQNCCDSSKNQEGSCTCKPFLRKHFRSKRPLWALSLIQNHPVDGWTFFLQFWQQIRLKEGILESVKVCIVYFGCYSCCLLNILEKGTSFFQPWHELLPSLLWRFFWGVFSSQACNIIAISAKVNFEFFRNNAVMRPYQKISGLWSKSKNFKKKKLKNTTRSS